MLFNSSAKYMEKIKCVLTVRHDIRRVYNRFISVTFI